MTKYAIERNGELVRHVVFLGDSEKDLYRKRDIQILLFEDEDEAKELLQVWPNAKVVDYKEYKAEKKKAA